MDINKPMKNIGNDLRKNLPHLYLGQQGITTSNPTLPQNTRYKQSIPRWPEQPYNPQMQEKLNKLPANKEMDLLDRLRFWGLLMAVLLVIGYAVYRLLFG